MLNLVYSIPDILMGCLGGRSDTDLQLKWNYFILHELKETSLVRDEISAWISAFVLWGIGALHFERQH